MKLAELQAYFAQAATSSNGPIAGLDRVFSGNARLPAEDRLAIYNRGYFYRLLDALASVFRQTKRVLGDSDFERLGLAYLAQHPSEHPAVERIGRSFSQYLGTVATPAITVDLAALEWARLCALVAPNPGRLATVQAIEPSQFPQARLRFVPSLQRLELDPRALVAYAGEDPMLEKSSAAASGIPRCTVAVWRSYHAVVHEPVSPLESRAWAIAASGATLSRVCAIFDDGSEAEDVRRALEVLSSWFARKWLEIVDSTGSG